MMMMVMIDGDGDEVLEFVMYDDITLMMYDIVLLSWLPITILLYHHI